MRSNVGDTTYLSKRACRDSLVTDEGGRAAESVAKLLRRRPGKAATLC